MNDSALQRPLNILLADDGSEHARSAVSLLCSLPLPSQSSITSLTVVTPLKAAEHAGFREYQKRTEESLAEKGVAFDAELVLGYPAEVLIEYADRHNPDLIVMGAKGLRATLGILLGGVAQQVVEYANRPVLVVRAPFTGLKRLLLVIDGSEYSWQAMEYIAGAGTDYRAFPLPQDLQVSVMHVLPPIPEVIGVEQRWIASADWVPPPPIPEKERRAWKEAQEREGNQLLDRAVEMLRASGIKPNRVMRHGDAATEILETIRSQQIDLVVCGSRGLSQVKGWLLGSVSRKLLHYANCSVLVVKK